VKASAKLASNLARLCNTGILPVWSSVLQPGALTPGRVPARWLCYGIGNQTHLQAAVPI